jgi:hypothetical protein
MGVLYSIYDALVSINVPNDKARAVADAMEMDMLEKLATRSDLGHVQDLLSRDIKAVELGLAHTRETLEKDIQSLATKTELSELGQTLTKQMYLAAFSSVALSCSILGILIALR